jgi:hypothetical protein
MRKRTMVMDGDRARASADRCRLGRCQMERYSSLDVRNGFAAARRDRSWSRFVVMHALGFPKSRRAGPVGQVVI